MGVGMEHAPLAIFTTLAPMAAASFVVLAYVFLAGKPSAEEAKRLDKWTALPAVFMALGMIASFFHLANPMNALFVFSGVGSSPLSNELLVTVVFAVVALVYWILGLAGKLPATGGARTVLLLVLAVGSVLQALFCGLAGRRGAGGSCLRGRQGRAAEVVEAVHRWLRGPGLGGSAGRRGAAERRPGVHRQHLGHGRRARAAAGDAHRPVRPVRRGRLRPSVLRRGREAAKRRGCCGGVYEQWRGTCGCNCGGGRNFDHKIRFLRPFYGNCDLIIS